ncbi:MAG: phosphate acetyltransferase [Sphaerochaetaceae bacterium]|jgi:phosphate acetyltransferase|nr:phosphate acetyltransferase [Sphaerochaetaceae bacterium]MDX9809492.1 phosphate acetyltransferase [Sphaerochaetaceae bacterium]
MTFAETMKAKAKALQKALVLPEGTEPRTVAAARLIVDQHLASHVTLLGKVDAVAAVAAQHNISLAGIQVIDPEQSPLRQAYADEYYQLRKHKGMTEQEAYEGITSVLRWGAMMVRKQDAHAMVAGAENTTGNVLLASFTIIKTKPGIKSASSCFVMATDKKDLGTNGSFIFADCATIPEPTAEQLAEIAEEAAESCRMYLGAEPVVALLSYSTKGSAKGPLVDKVTAALQLLQAKRPDIQCDGELQLDAAIIPSVGKSKAPGSTVAGRANVLVFPDLQAGNIGYKLVQRLAGAEAFGPILQGFARPVSDLSRGCSIEDIVVTSAITLAQAGA